MMRCPPFAKMHPQHRRAIARLTGVVSLILAIPAAGAIHSLPAPAGNATSVSWSAIKEAGHPCGGVAKASRMADGSIRAQCKNGEWYRVARIQGVSGVVAMRCSAAAAMGVSGC